jgi:diacylglycerol kinase (ATP)
MYDKLSVLIDVLVEEAAATSAEKSATAYADSDKAEGKPFVPQTDHIAKCKLELATRAQNLQKSLKLIIFQVEQGKGSRVGVEARKGSSGWFIDLPYFGFVI